MAKVHVLQTGIEYIWKNLETGGFTLREPDEEIINALAHLMHSADKIRDGEENEDVAHTLPIDSYKKLVMFRWSRHSEIGPDFYRLHGDEYNALKAREYTSHHKTIDMDTFDLRQHCGC